MCKKKKSWVASGAKETDHNPTAFLSMTLIYAWQQILSVQMVLCGSVLNSSNQWDNNAGRQHHTRPVKCCKQNLFMKFAVMNSPNEYQEFCRYARSEIHSKIMYIM